jgi:hypothetical protein
MVYGIYSELVAGANLNQHSHHVWGPHIAGLVFERQVFPSLHGSCIQRAYIYSFDQGKHVILPLAG